MSDTNEEKMNPEIEETEESESTPEPAAKDEKSSGMELEVALKQIEDLKRQVLYVQSDFQNYRRRKEDEQKDITRYAKTELIKELLPVIDNFERAMQAAEQSQSFEALIGGVSGTFKQLHTFLQKAGITTIDAIGKEFDPNFHDAIGQVESDEYEPNTVAEELQKGYMLNDRVLRPALVKVVG